MLEISYCHEIPGCIPSAMLNIPCFPPIFREVLCNLPIFMGVWAEIDRPQPRNSGVGEGRHDPFRDGDGSPCQRTWLCCKYVEGCLDRQKRERVISIPARPSLSAAKSAMNTTGNGERKWNPSPRRRGRKPPQRRSGRREAQEKPQNHFPAFLCAPCASAVRIFRVRLRHAVPSSESLQHLRPKLRDTS